MSSGCGDVLSLADLQTAKKHQIFEAEVITGKSGGVAGGADIDYATNPVTGQTQKTLPAVLRDAGFSPVSWDFSTGGTLTVNDRGKVVYDPVSKTWYSYAGTLPVVVPASFNPVGNANWKPQTDPYLRNDLAELDGSALVGAATYAQVRAYSGSATRMDIIGRSSPSDGGAGLFVVDPADTSTPDDDGTVLVDAAGRRWKRDYTGVKKAAWFGVTDGADVSANLQNALTLGGAGVYCDDGQFTISSKITVNHTDPTYPVMGRRSTRFDLVGSSMTGTTFNTNGTDFLEYIGTDGTIATQGIHSGSRLSDFTVYGTDNTGVALRLTGHAYLKVEDVYLVRNNAGITTAGVLSSEFNRINAQYNNYGMYINSGSNSTFNAVKINGIFNGNAIRGIEGEIGTKVNLENCNFEGNGTQGDTGTGAVYLRAKEPMSVINIKDCYFEANMGVADIQVDNLTSAPLIVNIEGCTFIRGNSSGGYCNYVIRVISTGGGRVIINLRGNHFFTQTAFGYVPDVTRPFISGGGFMTVNGMETCYFSETTSLSSSTNNMGTVISGSVSASGGGLALPGYLSITHPSTGVYTIESAYPLGQSADTFQAIAQTNASGFYVEYAQRVSTTVVRVVTRATGTNAVADCGFNFMISKSR